MTTLGAAPGYLYEPSHCNRALESARLPPELRGVDDGLPAQPRTLALLSRTHDALWGRDWLRAGENTKRQGLWPRDGAGGIERE